MRFDVDVVAVSEDIVQFVHYSRSSEFKDCFLLRPEGGEGGVGALRISYLLLLRRVHGFPDERLGLMPYLLDIDTDGIPAESYSYGVLGMGDTELNIRSVREERFPEFIVFETRGRVVQRGRDSTDELHEHEVRTEAAEPAVRVDVTEGFFASLRRDKREHARHFGVGAEVHMIENLN